MFSPCRACDLRPFYLADSLVGPTLILKEFIVRRRTNSFLHAAFDLVSCSTHLMFSSVDRDRLSATDSYHRSSDIHHVPEVTIHYEKDD